MIEAVSVSVLSFAITPVTLSEVTLPSLTVITVGLIGWQPSAADSSLRIYLPSGSPLKVISVSVVIHLIAEALITGLPFSTDLPSRFDITPLRVSLSLSGVSRVRTMCAPMTFSPAFLTL